MVIITPKRLLIPQKLKERGVIKTPSQTPEAADDARRVRTRGRTVWAGERRSPGLPAAAGRAGADRARAAGGRAALEGGPLPGGEDA